MYLPHLVCTALSTLSTRKHRTRCGARASKLSSYKQVTASDPPKCAWGTAGQLPKDAPCRSAESMAAPCGPGAALGHQQLIEHLFRAVRMLSIGCQVPWSISPSQLTASEKRPFFQDVSAASWSASSNSARQSAHIIAGSRSRRPHHCRPPYCRSRAASSMTKVTSFRKASIPAK